MTTTGTPTPTAQNIFQEHRIAALWIAAFAVTAVFAYGMSPWEVIMTILEEQGTGDDGPVLMAFVAGYTLPAVIATMCSYWIITVATRRTTSDETTACAVAGIIGVWIAAAVVCRLVGLGAVVEFADLTYYAGGRFGVLLTAVVWVGGAYVNVFGWGLTISAIAIGIALSATIQDKFSPDLTPAE